MYSIYNIKDNDHRKVIKMRLYKFFKRLCDILFSALGIIVCTPIMLVLCVICAADTHASPLFLQERVGRNGRTFKIIKLRTMKRTAPSGTPARDIPEEGHVSHLGAWLRKSGIDELPQLFNIFAGQMSFVGPRPLMLTEGRLHKQRHELGVYRVRPGLTGLAQIRSDSISSTEEKARIDSEYVENISFSMDVKIILSTIKLIFCGKHIDEHFHSPNE
jgi:O-antigen biosynthesis protein WbqP